MKKYFTILLLSIAPMILWSQPVITNAENFTIGTVLNFQQCDGTGISSGNSGANQTWDFSSLVPTGTYTEWIVTPSSTSHGSSFPDANLVEKNSDGTFVYVHATADSSYIVGFVDTVNNYLDIYPNSSLFALRPITFGNIATDTFTDMFSSPSYNFNGMGTSTINADAYGTLTLPNGTGNDI